MLEYTLSELGAQARLCVEVVNNIFSSQFGMLELWITNSGLFPVLTTVPLE